MVNKDVYMLLVNDDDDVGFSLAFCTTLLCFACFFIFWLCVWVCAW